MVDFQREKNVLRQLVQARNAIKHKYRLLKFGKENVEKMLHETFKPIVDPLEKLVIETKKNHQPKLVPELYDINEQSKVFDDNSSEDNEGDFETAASQDEDKTILNESLNTIDSEDGYLQLFEFKSEDLDRLYGVRKNNDSYSMGNSLLTFDKNNVIVDEATFPRTKGLMELLIMKNPNSEYVKKADLNNYRKILEISSVHKKHNQPNEAIKAYNSKKFNKYIAPMFKLTNNKSGGSLPRYKVARRRMSSMDYVYWDDPNELVDRLRLLMVERSAGNHSHTNEIHSIIEELRKGGYIY